MEIPMATGASEVTLARIVITVEIADPPPWSEQEWNSEFVFLAHDIRTLLDTSGFEVNRVGINRLEVPPPRAAGGLPRLASSDEHAGGI